MNNTCTDLPNSAWFAEHAMKWKAGIHDGIGAYYHDEEADYDYWISEKQDQHSWDPRTNDADALQMWEHVVPNPKELDWALNGLVYAIWADCARGGAMMREAVCRAVEAYVLAQDVHNTGTT